MAFSAFVFDLDGTLLDTLADIALAANTLLERHGWPAHPLDSYRRFVGSGFRMLVRRAMPPDALAGLDEAALDALVREGKELYSAGLWVKTAPYPGVTDALKALSARGCRLAVLSNKPDEQTARLVEHFWPGLFEIVRGGREGVPLKPDPAALLAIVKEFGLAREQVGYVGDSDVDMLTAANAGLFSLGVTWGFRGEAELAAAGAGALIREPGEFARHAV
ncbi:MAG: HAD-IA family hydrolase [Desulfovibrionaceae bacterium]|nr:HAD-IA family hydrolase [Desulfovibrionaceae bacterium]